MLVLPTPIKLKITEPMGNLRPIAWVLLLVAIDGLPVSVLIQRRNEKIKCAWRSRENKCKYPCPHGGAMHLCRRIRRGGDISSPITASSNSRSLLEMISDTKLKCWLALFTSIMLENLGSALLKAAREQKSSTFLIMAFSLFLLGNVGFFVAVAKIDLGVAYAVWSALGTMVLTTVGVVFFKESYDWQKLVCLILILTGVVGLNLREEH